MNGVAFCIKSQEGSLRMFPTFFILFVLNVSPARWVQFF